MIICYNTNTHSILGAAAAAAGAYGAQPAGPSLLIYDCDFDKLL